MDLTVLKGLVGLACFIQAQGGNIPPDLETSLSQDQVEIIRQIENPCGIILPEIPNELVDKTFEDLLDDEIVLAGGEPTMSYSR